MPWRVRKLSAGADTRWADAPETGLDQPRRWVPLELKEAAAAEARPVPVQVAEEVPALVLPGDRPEWTSGYDIKCHGQLAPSD